MSKMRVNRLFVALTDLNPNITKQDRVWLSYYHRDRLLSPNMFNGTIDELGDIYNYIEREDEQITHALFKKVENGYEVILTTECTLGAFEYMSHCIYKKYLTSCEK